MIVTGINLRIGSLLFDVLLSEDGPDQFLRVTWQLPGDKVSQFLWTETGLIKQLFPGLKEAQELKNERDSDKTR